MAHSASDDSTITPNVVAAAPRRETVDNLVTRELEPSDFERGFVKLLGQLTTVGDTS
ncbi:hypothetical protein BVRB_034520 [Beta vulgaris subsp. vulgaris]|uniref:Uncharacterized protein n=1 Tax=Beta vulgaris subsp. vulgaris TaxID=3555 RepID=A0A0J7YPT3_BETVV|nr:hypothetical protein BVRB_034520 [Beta vulgaris subsp. vulgaris]